MNGLAPNRQKMAFCCNELDSIRDIFNEKEKELTIAMAKVDALTRQLDELKDGNIINSYNISPSNSSTNGLVNCQTNSSKFNVELEKLKQELLYRTKLNGKINEEMILKQKQIDQRTIELNNIDQRINELKNRLNRKRSLNYKLNAQMKSHLLKSESTNNQSKIFNDNLNNENDVPNHSIVSLKPATLRRSIGAGQPYKFTHLKPLKAVEPLKQQPKSELNLTLTKNSTTKGQLTNDQTAKSSIFLTNCTNNSNQNLSSTINLDKNNHQLNSSLTKTTASLKPQQNKNENPNLDSKSITSINANDNVFKNQQNTSDQFNHQVDYQLNNDQLNNNQFNNQINNQFNNQFNNKTNNELNKEFKNHQIDNQENHQLNELNNQINNKDHFLKNSNQLNKLELGQKPRPKNCNEFHFNQTLPNQRLNAINNTAKYLIVDRSQKELVSNLNDNFSDFEDNLDNISTNLNNSLSNSLNNNLRNSSTILTSNNLNKNNDDLIKQSTNSPALSSVSSSNCSDFVPSTSSSTSDLPYQTNKTSSNYRISNSQNIQPTDHLNNENLINSSTFVKSRDQNGIEKGHVFKSVKQLQQNLINNSPAKVFNNSNNLETDEQTKNDIKSPINHFNKPDIIIDSTDKTKLIKASSLSNNLSNKIDDNQNDKNSFNNFGLLQTATPNKLTVHTDSENDSSSEKRTIAKYKSPLIKAPTSIINNRLIEKNNDLNRSNNEPNRSNYELNDNKSHTIKEELKISIDNSDWLKKRRPLIADIDLDFDKINNEMFETDADKKPNLANQKINKESYCNGSLTNLNKQDNLIIKDNLIKDKSQPKLENLDVLTSSSQSSVNHSPNSLDDELDTNNKIELRSVIRNIMCKNLGSSSDKSSSNQSGSEETDEDDENSVDCKAMINDIKPCIKNLSVNASTNPNNRIESLDNELNKSKEKSILINKKQLKITNNDEKYDSIDEKEDSDQLNYDSSNQSGSEDRTDDVLSSKDDITDNTDEINEDDAYSVEDVQDGKIKNLKSSCKSNSKKQISKKKKRRVSFDPLALFLDAALEGELELVKKTATQVSNPSASSEGVTALHNSICADHFNIVKFLVEIGCDVNAQDDDGWTPLHCAASCNNLPMVKYLVEHGACIFAVTLSDHETPAQKCEETDNGYQGCSKYLYSMQEKLGVINGGSVYAVYDYSAQQPDELSFKCNELLRILNKSDECETEWYWASNSKQQKGYVPRNLLSLYPRVTPKSKESIELEN